MLMPEISDFFPLSKTYVTTAKHKKMFIDSWHPSNNFFSEKNVETIVFG